jgi:hypothetical protein
VRVGVVDAVDRDLLRVGAEELPREHLRALAIEAVPRDHLLADDPLLDENTLRHVWMDHVRHDQVLVLGDELRDQLGAVRLLDEVELRAQVRLQLVRERGQLEQASRLGAALGERGHRAKQPEIERNLGLDPRPA